MGIADLLWGAVLTAEGAEVAESQKKTEKKKKKKTVTMMKENERKNRRA